MKNKRHFWLKKIKPELTFDFTQLIPVLNKPLKVSKQTKKPVTDPIHHSESQATVSETLTNKINKNNKTKKASNKKQKNHLAQKNIFNQKDFSDLQTKLNKAIGQIHTKTKTEATKTPAQKNPNLHKEKKKMIENMQKREDSITKNQQKHKGIEI